MDRKVEPSIEDLARALPDVDWEQPGFPQPKPARTKPRVVGL